MAKRGRKKKRLGIFNILFELIILYAFSSLMFSLGYITGIFYLVAITIAIFEGILFRTKWISFMIVFGTILTFVAGQLALVTIDNALAGDIIGAAIFFVVAVFIWQKGRKMKKGKRY
ncbi:hypothetical protein GF378_01895 [Candidatus Pacearchaeota archaeon]|nr:hypothetical protein [Candidatus Pacearchaeota archaeon]